MPVVLSMCQGGIWRATTRFLIERAHGRASSKLTSDIGAIESGRWQDSHFSRKIGATSLVKVGLAACSAAAVNGSAKTAPRVNAPNPVPRRTTVENAAIYGLLLTKAAALGRRSGYD